ncbi:MULTISPECIES: relaxase/mobilization nuclease domain-containing protein [Cysteiniphilum]|uniref:MobA/VirD2-like nuclease domain-containing protein n=1 Tax=Cysteiniphilum litorale TaxID=2056700 RepID=A0A8J2Z2P7_9GAMM|nr:MULTISPECIES: hypothetical protein [Cysteiniphilum]GGF91481.1 hypothetical protein GCM10010995_05880 [Cysteiniphilum litorale]
MERVFFTAIAQRKISATVYHDVSRLIGSHYNHEKGILLHHTKSNSTYDLVRGYSAKNLEIYTSLKSDIKATLSECYHKYESTYKQRVQKKANNVISGVIYFNDEATPHTRNEIQLMNAARDFVDKFTKETNSVNFYIVLHKDEHKWHFHFLNSNFDNQTYKSISGNILKKKFLSDMQSNVGDSFSGLGFHKRQEGMRQLTGNRKKKTVSELLSSLENDKQDIKQIRDGLLNIINGIDNVKPESYKDFLQTFNSIQTYKNELVYDAYEAVKKYAYEFIKIKESIHENEDYLANKLTNEVNNNVAHLNDLKSQVNNAASELSSLMSEKTMISEFLKLINRSTRKASPRTYNSLKLNNEEVISTELIPDNLKIIEKNDLYDLTAIAMKNTFNDLKNESYSRLIRDNENLKVLVLNLEKKCEQYEKILNNTPGHNIENSREN